MGKQRRLNTDVVVAAAVQLANEQGSVDALSLKTLAAALDVRVPSLYNHVDGLDGLRYQMTLAALRDLLAMTRAALVGKTGEAALFAVAETYRAFAHANRGIYGLILAAADSADSEQAQLGTEFITLLQLILSGFGLSGDAALHHIRVLRSLLHGFVSLELAAGFKMMLSTDESYTAMVEMFVKNLAPTND